MNQKAVIIVVLIGVIGIGAYALLNRDSSMQGEKNVATDSLPTQSAESITEGKVVKYGEYTSANMEQNKLKRRVLFFYASWCPTCKAANEELQSRSVTLPDDVAVLRVNYNDTDTDTAEKELATKYGIAYQHTFVLIDADGNEIEKWNGGGVDEIISHINK